MLAEMTTPSAAVAVIALAAVLKYVHSQGLVSIEFTTAPVLATSGKPAAFSIVTVSDIFSTTWTAPDGGAIGTWTSAGPAINSDYKGRVTLTATQLQFIAAELRDAGNYSVNVAPSDTTGLKPNTRSVELKVFVGVAGVSLGVVPSVPVEGWNVTLRCTWSAGTQISVAWGRGNTALTSGNRIIISGGTLVINPARRDDTGDYSCTVSNPVSVETVRISLTVYYGPDTPILTKKSADCVGGGDAVVGQALQITCTSESLPPAIFSWQYKDQSVSSSQSSTGSLSLQISSSDQSGRYTCTAQNSITGGSSQQKTEVSVVDICLGGGPVAGIVIACFLVIVIIIIIIIVLIRQRNMDRRLQDATSLQKTSQEPVALPPPANIRAEPVPYLSLNNINTQRPSYNQPNISSGHTNNWPQNGVNNSNTNNAVQQNGTLQRNGNTATTFGNGYSGHQSNGLLPNPGQQNPNIQIQTQPGPLQPTVHVNLNTLPRTDQQNLQPQTVNVNLNTYPPTSPGRQEVNAFSTPQDNMQPQNNINSLGRHNQNGHQDNRIQTGYQYVNPVFQPDVNERRVPPPSNDTPQRSLRNGLHNDNDFVQAHRSRLAEATHAGHHNNSRQPSTDHDLRHSAHTRRRTRDSEYPSDPNDSRDRVEPGARHRQRPWDTLRGTPSYPNHQANQSDASSCSTDSHSSDWQPRPSQTAQPRGQPLQTSRPTRREARAREREPQRVNGQREDHSPVFMDPNAQRQRAQQALSNRQQNQPQQRQAVSQTQNTATQAKPSRMVTTPTQSNAPHMPTMPQPSASPPHSNPQKYHPPPHVTQVSQVDRLPHMLSNTLAQSRPEQRPAAPQGTNAQVPRTSQNPSLFTQAAPQNPTRHTHNPFSNGNQQTQTALQNPRPQAGQQPQAQPSQVTQPPVTQKTNGVGRRPPTPPPVLQPFQFETIPRDRLQPLQHRAAAVPPPGAVPVVRHPVHVPVMHRPPGATHRPPRHLPANTHRHPGNAHLHANLQRHTIAHRPPPAHMRQVHRGRPRR